VIKHSTDGLLFFGGGRDMCSRMDWAFFRYTSTSRSITFLQLEDAAARGSIVTILASLSRDGLTFASV